MPRRSRRYEALGVAHIGTLLAEAIGDEDRVKQALGVWPAWEQAVGRQIARASRPASLRQGVLTVHVRHSVWMQELNAMRETLLRRIQRVSGGASVHELRLKIAPMERDKPEPRAPKKAPTPRRGPIPYDLARQIREIDSPTLRARLLGAAASWAGKK